MSGDRRPLARVVALLVLVPVVLLATAPIAAAVDGETVYVDRTDGGLELSVQVPADVAVDLDGPAEAIIDGVTYPADAASIANVERTTILVIDASNSMRRGTRLADAKAAARAFLRIIPNDVQVGIVAFASEFEILPPTLDRQLAETEIDTLTTSPRTRLYDAVDTAVGLTGSSGQRGVLVISDGADTDSEVELGSLVATVEASEVRVDVVGLQQEPGELAALTRIAGTRGTVVDGSSRELRREFAAAAQGFARQVAVTVSVPPDAIDAQAQGEVRLTSDQGDVVAPFLVPDLGTSGPAPLPDVATDVDRLLPIWAMYAGVGVLGVGLLVGLVALVPTATARPRTAEARISTYTAGILGRAEPPASDQPALAQATEVIDGVLRRNRGLDEQISGRLLAAGSALRPSEWLLLHGAIAVGALVLGLLLGRGAPALGVLFLVLGVIVPWLYLGLRRGRRRRRFDAALPETLQLMSGSLSAGLSLQQAVDTIVREGSDPVSTEFRRVLVEIRLGVSLDDALEGVAERFDSRDFRWVVMAIRIQRQVGGNLAELLTTVSTTIREREYIRRQVDSLAAEGKMSALVLAALPPGFLLYLVVAQPSYVAPLFTDLRGIIMLAGATVWLGIGIAWMSRVIKVEV